MVGVAVAYAISTTLVEPIQTVLTARCLGVSPMVFLRSVGGVFQAAIGMCAAVLALRAGLVDAGVLCLWRVPELAAEARRFARRRTAPAAPLAPVAAVAES